MTDDGSATRIIMFETENGPSIMAVEVDPPQDKDSVDIEIEEPAISRVITPTINPSLLASLIGQCKSPRRQISK